VAPASVTNGVAKPARTAFSGINADITIAA